MSMKINHYFKKHLDVPQEPPVDSWEFIEQRINQQPKKRKPLFPFWMFASGIAASLALIGGSVYVFNPEFFNGNENNSIVKNESSSSNSSLDFSNENQNQLESNSSLHLLENSSSSEYPNSTKSIINSQSKNFITSNQNSSYGKNSTFSSLNNFNSDNTISNNDHGHIAENSTIENPHIEKFLSQSLPNWTPDFVDSNQVIENILQEPLHSEKTETLLAVNKPDQEKKKIPQKKKVEFDRFYISGFISPMALNTFVGNSMLADQMSQYRTENNVLLAYGMKGGYAISPRVKLRTGISVIGFEQITKDVPLSYQIEGRESLPSDMNQNIKYEGNLRIDNTISMASSEISNKIGTGDIQQQSQYLEIPIEAEVALFKTNSIGISATGGGSTWILSKNKIFAHTEDFTEELGKANNLNNTSFSANAGLKFDMNLTENIQLNVEPTFKYLINPVNDIKNYNPYTVGVNAGVSISFK